MAGLDRGRSIALLFALVLGLGACPPEGTTPGEDGGAAPPDACNSLEEALSLPECALALGETREAFLAPAGDEDWYSFRVPADANARTLLHVTGSYGVPNTAVNLSLNLLRADGQQSLARKSDRHGQGPPSPVDIVLPFAEPDAQLVLLVSDDPVNPSRPGFDVRAPYRLQVEVLQDPDANEPNDTTPTAIPLTAQNGAQAGTAQGYLSTDDDVDGYAFDAEAGKVLYLAVTAPALTPPPPFQVSYRLLSPSGTPLSEGTVANAFLEVNLATARRLTETGTYTLWVRGYTGQNATEPVAGDPRLQFNVDVRIFDEADPSELTTPNDTLESATAVSLSAAGQSQTVTGRLGSVPDADWYRVTLAAHNAPSVLRYRLRPGAGAGRFPALPGLADRELRVLREVTGGTAMANQTACLQDPAVCPRSFGDNQLLAGLVAEQCGLFDPPRCLWALRQEHVEFDGLRNFEGTLPIPPHASSLPVYLLVQDRQNNWADDVSYTLEVEWRADPDEATRFGGGAVEQTPSKPLAPDSAASTFPVPPTGAAYELTGRLSHGYGFLRRHNPNQGEGVRAPQDYDAVSSDRDRFELTLPALDPDAGSLDRTWELEWEVNHLPDGGMPYELAIDLEFCDGSLSTGQCVPVRTTTRGTPLTLAYSGSPTNAWHTPNAPASVRQPLYDRDVTSLSTTTTARAYGCFCLEPRFIQGGRMFLSVVGVDRRSYAETGYRVRTAYTDYPKSYTANDGGTLSCPPPSGDGGCAFTYQP